MTEVGGWSDMRKATSQGMQAASRSRKTREWVCPSVSRKHGPCRYLHFRLLTFRTTRRQISVVLSH